MENTALMISDIPTQWVDLRYCGVFVFPNPSDPTEIWGYYTLSQFTVTREEMTRKHRNKALLTYIPLVLIGFMGKRDGTPAGLGAGLLVDAARRAYRHVDIPAWGMALQPEGGKENQKLWSWYENAGFTPAKTSQLMYAPFENLIPELTN